MKRIWIFLIVLILIVGGYFLFFNDSQTGESNTKPFQETDNENSNPLLACQDIDERLADKVFCYKNVAKEKEDLFICDKIYEDMGENAGMISVYSCYSDVASVLGDDSICEEKIPAESAYQDVCFLNVAISTEDFSLCERISDFSNARICYREIGAKRGDESECEQVEDAHNREKCYVGVASNILDVSICEDEEKNFRIH